MMTMGVYVFEEPVDPSCLASRCWCKSLHVMNSVHRTLRDTERQKNAVWIWMTEEAWMLA